jgi:nucleotidyltransferase AbiEii toxin of type IV toxin-antitoxin system
MTGQPEEVPPLIPGIIPDIHQTRYKAYPLVDHVADKVAATYERHGDAQTPSTRFRDLVDLVSIVSGATIGADSQRIALTSEFRRRGLPLPTAFGIPDRSMWTNGYAAEARRSLLVDGRTLDEALAIFRPFIDPLLDGTASGMWDHKLRVWAPSA